MAPVVAKPSRPKLIQALFRALDSDSSGRLGARKLQRFAEWCGFDGSSEDWDREFREVCKLYGWSSPLGPDLRQFWQLVNDRKGVGYSTDTELEEVIAELGSSDSADAKEHQMSPSGDKGSWRRGASTPRTPDSPGQLGRTLRSASADRAAPRPGPQERHRNAVTPPASSPPSIRAPYTPRGAAGAPQQSPEVLNFDGGRSPMGRMGLHATDDSRTTSSPSASPSRPPAWGREACEASLDIPVQQFVDWASSRWDVIHNIFKLEDKHQYVVKGAIGRRGVSLPEWVRRLREMGFMGDAKVIFDEIEAECKNDKEDRRRDLTRGFIRNRSARTTVFHETISLAQLLRFKSRVADMNASFSAVCNDGSAASRFAKFMLQQRGTLLRAWRLDLDIRGAGKVAYVDFAHACRRLGVAVQTRPIWSSLRSKDDSRPLEFVELAREEGANLEGFAELLWNTWGFDLEKAWNLMDVNCQHWLSMEEFETGARKLGFNGNARLLFRGLDTSGLGRVWRTEFDYIKLVSRVAPRKLQHGSGAITELIQWAQRKLGGPEDLVAKLGLAAEGARGGPRSIGVGDFAVHLAALGFEGDAREAASKVARQEGGIAITAETLAALFSNIPAPEPPPPASPPSARPRQRARPKQVWNDSLIDTTACNLNKPKGQRAYFSKPTTKEEVAFSPPSRRHPKLLGSQSASSLQVRKTMKTTWNGTGLAHREDKPCWNDHVDIRSCQNDGLPACHRSYFSDPADKPVKEDLTTRMVRSQSARLPLQASPQKRQESPVVHSLVVRFRRFILSRFGSLDNAFGRLDVDGSGQLRQRDFVREVQRAGWTENPNAVFQQLDQQRRGAVSLQEFASLGQEGASEGRAARTRVEMY